MLSAHILQIKTFLNYQQVMGPVSA